MKKLISFALMAIAALAANAQDIQLHYDFGRNIYPDQEPDCQKVTITLEQFKADPWGSWYYFVDLDLSSKFFRSAYAEISREFKFGKKSPFAAHLEYNGGLGRDEIRSFQHAALLGGAYNGHNDDFSKTWSVQLLYKRFFKSYEYTSSYDSFQLTGVWGLNFANKKCTFSGFIEFWRGVNWRPGHVRATVCLSSSPSRSSGIMLPTTSLSAPRWRSATTSSTTPTTTSRSSSIRPSP